ncbi:unnamed protein product [Plutella xylostella]|uniref:Dipeptidase n=1 Tax=Plutella xylostella TaxID=51655 RepID=A0A8S4GC25_PLUXY|nr:unnamed protein product [Plutella xylostella]
MKIAKRICSADDQTDLQSDLCRLDSYCLANKLDLNVSKCYLITFTRKIRPLQFGYSLKNTDLIRVNQPGIEPGTFGIAVRATNHYAIRPSKKDPPEQPDSRVRPVESCNFQVRVLCALPFPYPNATDWEPGAAVSTRATAARDARMPPRSRPRAPPAVGAVYRVTMRAGTMRRALTWSLLALTAVVAAASYDRERLEIAKQILEEVPLIDGHNDLPWNIRKFLRNQINEFELDQDLTRVEPWSISKYSHTDLPRMREGMVGAQRYGRPGTVRRSNLRGSRGGGGGGVPAASAGGAGLHQPSFVLAPVPANHISIRS